MVQDMDILFWLCLKGRPRLAHIGLSANRLEIPVGGYNSHVYMQAHRVSLSRARASY